VTRMVAQVLRDLKAADQSGLQARYSSVLFCGGNLQRRLYNRAAAEEINQQKGCEEEENQ